MIRLALDLIFAVAIALAVAYGLAAVLREYTAVTWWQVLDRGRGGVDPRDGGLVAVEGLRKI